MSAELRSPEHVLVLDTAGKTADKLADCRDNSAGTAGARVKAGSSGRLLRFTSCFGAGFRERIARFAVLDVCLVSFAPIM